MLNTAHMPKSDLSAERDFHQMPQRSDLRYRFIAKIEVLDAQSGKRIECATSNLSRYGCHIKTITPFLRGTTVNLKIIHGGAVFESSAMVVYAIDGDGMGVHFGDVGIRDRVVLKEWLAEIAAQELEERLRNSPQPRIKLSREDKLLLFACGAGVAGLIFGLLAWVGKF